MARDNKVGFNPKDVVAKAEDNKEVKLKESQDVWVATSTVPYSAPEFKPEKDLAFLKTQGNKITDTYEYRNINHKLLGYAVRIEEIETGKKQVLPVAYCHNEAKGVSRWQLKGFSDNGTKTIYRLEKLSGATEKPILY